MLEGPLLSVVAHVFTLLVLWDFLLGANVLASPHLWNGDGNLEALLKRTKQEESLVYC